MGNLRRPLVLPPYLYRLVGLARHQPRTGEVELRGEYPVLGVEAARLGHGRRRLEAVTRAVIPEVHGSVVGAAHGDAVVVYRKRVDHGAVPREIFYEAPVGANPLLEGVGGAGEEGVLVGRLGEGAHGLLVVREGRHALAGGQVP